MCVLNKQEEPKVLLNGVIGVGFSKQLVVIFCNSIELKEILL